MPAAEPEDGGDAVRVAVPNRVDLAGGTLDIYPLYLLVPGSMTVNAAIDVMSRLAIRRIRRGARLVSGNFDARAEADDTHGFPLKGRFGLVAAAFRAFPAARGLEIAFRNEAPVGSGLGASSSLLVAAMLGMDALLGLRRGWKETARRALEIEAAHLGTLTGCQDHIAALRGGIQGIRFSPGMWEAERFPSGGRAARALQAHGFLAGTGRPHHSGAVNWRMIRGAIEGRREVLRKFVGIAAAAREAWDAVREGDAVRAGSAMAREWRVRKTLAPGVTTRAVEEILAGPGFRRLVAGAKLCGAGGGGMFFGLLRDPGDRQRLEAILADRGFAILPFRLSSGPQVVRVGDGPGGRLGGTSSGPRFTAEGG